MNRKNVLYSIFTVLIIGLSSCAPCYIPNKVNAPLLKTKGEFKGGINGGYSGFDPQLSYALSNHVGLMVNGSFANHTSDTSGTYQKHQFAEVGVGYFTKIGSTQFVFEVYGGLGIGGLESKEENNLFISRAKVNSTRFFVQPTFGYVSDNFEFGFAPRFILANLKESSSTKTCVYLEPAITGKIGFRYLKAVFQIGESLPLTNSPSYQPLLMSVGLEVTIGKKRNPSIAMKNN